MGKMKLLKKPLVSYNKREEFQEENTTTSVLENKKEEKIDAFNPEDDVLAGKSREEILEELGKTGVTVEPVKGKVVTDLVTGEKISSTNISDEEDSISSLQEIEPENLKKYLTTMVKQSLTTLIPEELSEEEKEKIIADFEAKLIKLDKEAINKMSYDEVKHFYGEKLFNSIRKVHDKEAFKLAKKLLIDFKDGIVEYNGIIDTMEEINKHLKFFKESGIEDLQKNIQKEVSDGEYKTEFHKYMRYLELYIEKLQSEYKDTDNKFIQEEIRISKEKLEAVNEALSFRQIFKKCETAKDKLLKDFKDSKLLYKTISDFLGKLSSDPTMNISFPLPKGFNVKSDVTKILTSVWLSFFEMCILRYRFNQLENISIAQYKDMIDVLYGKQIEIPVNDEENMFDVNKFIEEIGITRGDCEEARKTGIAVTYIIARTFKPNSLNDQKQKYILSYTMNILSQGMNKNYAEIINELITGIKERLAS